MIVVLRIGHRVSRDKRITTHCALVARAFGADAILISTKDEKLKHTIKDLCKKFGGSFAIETGVNPKKVIENWKGIIIHLTMYGDSVQKIIKKIEKTQDMLVIIGAEKVPPYYYDVATYNLSIGSQPHSEVAALAIFLDRYLEGSWQEKDFNGDLEIVPSKTGKLVLQKEGGKYEQNSRS